MTHMTRSEERKRELAQEVILYLNEILALDRQALHQLIGHSVPVNPKLGEHETLQTRIIKNDPNPVLGVSVLGLLNGLVGVRDDQWGYITAVYGDDDQLQSFELTKREGDASEEMHPDVGDQQVADIDAGMLINGHRREFVDSVQYYLNELLEDDNPQHVIGHIESECRDYSKLIRDALKVYGNGYPPPAAHDPEDEFCSCDSPSVCHSGMCSNCKKIGRD